jgi:hypothetical protein
MVLGQGIEFYKWNFLFQFKTKRIIQETRAKLGDISQFDQVNLLVFNQS